MNSPSITLPQVVDRPLLIGGCAWLLISLVLNRGMDSTTWMGHGDPASLVPAMRGLLQSVMIGIGLIWPVWRLSGPTPRHPGLRLLGDAMLLVGVTEAVILLEHIQLLELQPGMRTIHTWSATQTLLIGLTLAVWTLPALLWTWVGLTRETGVSRTAAMFALILTLTGGWILAGLLGTTATATWSPWYALWTACEPQTELHTGHRLLHLMVVVMVTTALWVGFMGRLATRRATAATMVETRRSTPVF